MQSDKTAADADAFEAACKAAFSDAIALARCMKHLLDTQDGQLEFGRQAGAIMAKSPMTHDECLLYMYRIVAMVWAEP